MRADLLIAELQGRIDDVLRPLLQRHRTCALLDFPNQPNVGDSAIWLAEEGWLQAAGTTIAYRCDIPTFSPEALRAAISRGVILLSGGGNLGDLWPAHQHFREHVVQSFPHCPIIQLPQSISFNDPRNLARARSIFNAHPDLTLLLRDEQSLELARTEFRTRSILCPDMALALGPLARPASPVVKVFWLARNDIEAGHAEPPTMSTEVERRDWLVDNRTLTTEFDTLLRWAVRRYPRWTGSARAIASSNVYRGYFRRIARARLARGLRLLGRGQVVVTDRLHGHILSLLMGVPHVALDTRYGKVKSFHTTWTKASPITYWADSPEEAQRVALAIAGGSTMRSA